MKKSFDIDELFAPWVQMSWNQSPMNPLLVKSLPKTPKSQSEAPRFGGSHNYKIKQNKLPSFIEWLDIDFFKKKLGEQCFICDEFSQPGLANPTKGCTHHKKRVKFSKYPTCEPCNIRTIDKVTLSSPLSLGLPSPTHYPLFQWYLQSKKNFTLNLSMKCWNSARFWNYI